jgi:hypothetical protein
MWQNKMAANSDIRRNSTLIELITLFELIVSISSLMIGTNPGTGIIDAL